MLCAVYWCQRHFREIVFSPTTPAFQIPSEHGSIPLTYPLHQKLLKLFGARTGLDPEKLSSHSLRRGGCTFLAKSGVSIEEIWVRGDWASDAIFQYINTPLSIRIVNDMRVAPLIAGEWWLSEEFGLSVSGESWINCCHGQQIKEAQSKLLSCVIIELT